MDIEISAEEMTYRTTYGKTTDGEPACCYCGARLHDVSLTEVPVEDDDELWAQLAHYHAADCRWIATRAHSR